MEKIHDNPWLSIVGRHGTTRTKQEWIQWKLPYAVTHKATLSVCLGEVFAYGRFKIQCWHVAGTTTALQPHPSRLAECLVSDDVKTARLGSKASHFYMTWCSKLFDVLGLHAQFSATSESHVHGLFEFKRMGGNCVTTKWYKIVWNLNTVLHEHTCT